MTNRSYRASKARSNRPGWSVTFNHPRRSDARGKLGLKVRRGLGTTDEKEADRLVEQLNAILADETWWSVDRRTEAENRFDSIVVSAFFDGIEAGSLPTKDLRGNIIPLPSVEEGYARVMLAGSTGAGKTTLLRHLIGSDHRRDRFPSTSTAKTTTADIEIITAPGPFEAVITFMTEHEVRCAVDECLEEACISAIRDQGDKDIAGALLEHREQRFRLSYILGTWQQEETSQQADAQHEMEFEFKDENEAPEAETLAEDEIIADSELILNNERLSSYVTHIREIAMSVRGQKASERGDFKDMVNANQRQAWLEDFVDGLYENQDFSRLSLDIMEEIERRFGFVKVGAFEHTGTDWPTLWYYEENDRDTFLKQVRWFTGNQSQQFGRLLTPMVDGIRVRGPFRPAGIELEEADPRLVFLDGEGLGHSAKEATSVSTRVTERFPEADMILLVDNAESPMQAAPLELLRSVGSSGHGHKLAVVFTHFDQVQGDNLSSYDQRVNHVRASIGNAIASLRDTLGAPVTEILERQLQKNDFYLGGLNRATRSIPSGFRQHMRVLVKRIKEFAEPLEQPVDIAPIYNIVRLELALRDATDGFKGPWMGRLGLSYHDGEEKVHWGRIKALCRRIANRWANEYSDLRPVADFVRQLQSGISIWLDNPVGWTRQPASEEQGQAVINAIRQKVYVQIHVLAEGRLVATHRRGWQTAFGFSGPGSSFERAREMGQIYNAAAPSISSVMEPTAQRLLDQVLRIITDAVTEAGGSVNGLAVSDIS